MQIGRFNTYLFWLLSGLCFLIISSPLRAQEDEDLEVPLPELREKSGKGIISLKNGAVFPGISTNFSPGVSAEFEAGYLLPFMGHAFGVKGSLSMASFRRDLFGIDQASLKPYTNSFDEIQYAVGVGIINRIYTSTVITPYTNIGAKFAMINTTFSGNLGEQIYTPVRRQFFRVGFDFQAGLEVRLHQKFGIFTEFQLNYLPNIEFNPKFSGATTIGVNFGLRYLF